MATCRCSRLVEALSHARRRDSSACRAARWRRARRADLIVVDLDEPWIVQEDGIRSRSKNTCFEGARLQGKVLANHGCGPHSSFRPEPVREMIDARNSLGALVFGYLLGSIPFGLLITRAAGLGDVRTIGSGNIGATNVLRTGNKGLAALTLLLDALKGTAAVLIGRLFRGRLCGIIAGFARVPRPLLPGLAQLQGRQGRRHLSRRAAGLYWPAALAFAAVWLGVAFLTALFLARRAHRRAHRAGVPLSAGRWRRRRAVRRS